MLGCWPGVLTFIISLSTRVKYGQESFLTQHTMEQVIDATKLYNNVCNT